MRIMKTRLTAIIGITAASFTGLAYYGTQPGNIGIAIGTRDANGPLHIALVFPGSPAAEAGVKTNWHLISIDGTNVVSESSTRCMTLLHGAVGTSVALELADPERR